MLRANISVSAVGLVRVPGRFGRRSSSWVRTNCWSSSRGLTLIEIMIALTMTLIILGAMMTAFQSVSRRMQDGRALIELANRVRNVESTLRSDLSNLTVEPRPYTTTYPAGYFQIVEGPRNDATMAATINNVMGDVDDALSMTIQSKGKMFQGRFVDITGTPQLISSPIAEVSWFSVWNETGSLAGVPEFEDSIELRRRVLLVRPDLVLSPPGGASHWNWQQVLDFFLTNDISVRIEPVPFLANSYRLVPNQLADLAVRKNRFGHLGAVLNGNEGAFLTWPLGFNEPISNSVDLTTQPVGSLGFPNQLSYRMLIALSSVQDVVLTDVTAFDVRVYSPDSAVSLANDNNGNPSFIVEPGDIGAGALPAYGSFGAFIDLNGGGGGWFSAPSANGSGLMNFNSSWPPGAIVNENTFDTWTPAYENDGIDQDGNGVIDQGTDGLDNDGVNGVDDIGERETVPPYNHPIRGIEIRIRTVEKLTKQVHQTTIIQSFVPE